ncbi:MAG: PLP-dependent transferase, partial [Candidatus Aenigmarchaeota archaeon]|nr:PLP-dependent transferase [Candidatus Aenigmarchaeota archaeon]
MKLSTKAVRAGEQPEAITGAVTTPIFQTATYALDQVGVLKGKGLWPDGFDYSRVSHPTKAVLENKLCQLEGGKRCLAFSSGMAAITALMHTLKARDHIIFSEDVYGGIHRLLKQVLNKFGLESDFIDTNNLELVQNTIRENTKMLFVETPTNPLLIVYDIRALAKLAA